MKQLARLVKAGGSLLITELCSHNQSWARRPAAISGWASNRTIWPVGRCRGLTPGESLYIGLKNGFQIQARHFSRPAPDDRLTHR